MPAIENDTSRSVKPSLDTQQKFSEENKTLENGQYFREEETGCVVQLSGRKNTD